VHLGYRRDALGDVAEGFGFLVPRGEGPRILGALWASDIFEGRAPAGGLLITVMIGGAHDPAAVELKDESLIALARADLERTMGLLVAPYFSRIIRHPRGIPQYDVGHVARLAAIDRRLEAFPGLWLGGSALRGISVNSCVSEAPRLAEAALEFFASSESAAAV
jgi:oxygen-dependent protoporphyrinogen oxidase